MANPYPKSSPKQKEPKGEAKFYLDILDNTKPSQLRSYLTGSALPQSVIKTKRGRAFFSMFAHVLPKGNYPELRLHPLNIILLTPEEHHLWDQGSFKEQEEYEKAHPGARFELLDNYRKWLYNSLVKKQDDINPIVQKNMAKLKDISLRDARDLMWSLRPVIEAYGANSNIKIVV